MNFRPATYHHKTIVKGFVLLSRAKFKCSRKLNCYQGKVHFLREAEARLVLMMMITPIVKGGDHHEGQLHYEFQTKIRSIVPRSTAFSLPVAIS